MPEKERTFHGWGCFVGMPGYIPMSGCIHKTKAGAISDATNEKRRFLDDTFDVDKQRQRYRCDGNIRRDWIYTLEPRCNLGYGGADYHITVEPIDCAYSDLGPDQIESLEQYGCYSLDQ